MKRSGVVVGDLLYSAGSALLIVSALLAVACVAAQALLARWWATPGGRHVMAFQFVLAAVLTLWALRVWIPDSDLIRVLRSVAFAGVPVVLAWRLGIIFKTWRGKRREHRREGA
ncbi:putative phage holin [Nonomuraea sp. CA-218870]|uniref:putative phage holin n=1 Tax=Nonomuraea sp. CA-218870 TaxID=3239998 RepID=UPI003D89DE49